MSFLSKFSLIVSWNNPCQALLIRTFTYKNKHKTCLKSFKTQNQVWTLTCSNFNNKKYLICTCYKKRDRWKMKLAGLTHLFKSFNLKLSTMSNWRKRLEPILMHQSYTPSNSLWSKTYPGPTSNCHGHPARARSSTQSLTSTVSPATIQ
jgi:hypothetical protein